MSARLHRRWFQFSIRGVMVLMTVVAIGAGLWVGKLHRRHQAILNLQALEPRSLSIANDAHEGTFQKWLARLVGKKFFAHPVVVSLRAARCGDGYVNDDQVGFLGQFTRLQRLDLNSTATGDQGMPYLRGLKDLRQLDLASSRAGDAALANMSELSRILSLNLSGTQVTDAGLRHLEHLATLEDLNLGRTSVTGAGIGWLKGLKNLEWLTLSDTKVDDRGLAVLGGFSLLRGLLLDRTPLTGSGFSAVGHLPALTRLDLSKSAITDDGLLKLPPAPSLERLNLNDTQITDKGLQQVGQFESLQRLELRGTRVTGKALSYLQTLPRLRHLNLCDTGIDDADIDTLNAICSLDSVSLSGTRVTENGLAKLQVIASLGGQPLDDPTSRALGEKTDVDFARQPLADVVEYLQQRHGVPILIDPRLSDERDGGLFPITCDRRGISLLEALKQITTPLDLEIVFRHSVLWIVAKPVKPVLQIPELAEGEELSSRLVSVLAQETELDLANQSLSDVLDYLSQRHAIEIRVDGEAFLRANRSSDPPVTRTIKRIPLQSALGLLLEPLDMTCTSEGEALLIRPR